MSRHPQNPPPAAFSGGTVEPRSSLLSTLGSASRLTDVLPALHEQALALTGGHRSLLFEHNPRTGALHPTSAYGLSELNATPWEADAESPDGMIAQTFARHTPMLVSDLERQLPDLAARLVAAAALLIPIGRSDERVGLLAVGFEQVPDLRRFTRELDDVGDGFATALELFRHRAYRQLQRDTRDLMEEFAALLATSQDLGQALTYLCRGIGTLAAADRASVWLHDRDARELVLTADSGDTPLGDDVRVSVDDALVPAAVALRQARAELIAPGADLSTSVVTVPLRGFRRALGTLLLEGVRIETGAELDLLDRIDEIGRQAAGAVETLQLVTVVRTRHQSVERAFNSLVHLVVIIDTSGTIRHVNDAFALRVQRARRDLIGMPVSDCLGQEIAAWVGSLPEGPLAGGSAIRDIDDRLLRGTFAVAVTDVPAADGSHGGRVIVARDLTAPPDLELEREARRRQLTQSEKLAALGQFVAGIAHELNNPLQSVLGHLELMRATDAGGRGLRPQIQVISREADRAAKIVRNLLVFAGSGRVARRLVNVNATMRRVVTSRQSACRAAHVEIVRHYDDTIPRIKSDPLMLHQVFLNVVLNAEQAVIASGRPGRIDVVTALDRVRERLVVTIRDTGPGIPADAVSRVFEPFFTTKDVGKGTGLGLAIAYGIVQDHGGSIAASNHPDGGALFTIELPLEFSA